MARYATRLGRDPAATYRQIDVAGRTAEADPHRLVELLYDELIHALRTVAWAAEHRRFKVKSDKATRATAILFALTGALAGAQRAANRSAISAASRSSE